MSTILKALQRLEDEKVAEVERSLDERIVARRASPRPTPHLGLAIAVAAISGVAVAVAAFVLWPGRDDSDARLAQQPPPAATAPVAAAAPAPVVAAEQPQPEAPSQPVAAAPEQSQIQVEDLVEVVERLDAQPADSAEPVELSEPAEPLVVTRPTTKRPAAQKGEMPVVRETKPETAPQVEPEVEPAPQVVSRAPKPRPAAAYVRSEQPPAVERPAPAAEPTAKSVAPLPEPKPAPQAEPAPRPAPLAIAAAAPQPEAIRPAEQKVIPRAKVPALTLERTIWHPDPSRRLAIVKLLDSEEPLRLKEGDAIGPLVVKSIKPSSVVFDHDGIQVTYTVGG